MEWYEYLGIGLASLLVIYLLFKYFRGFFKQIVFNVVVSIEDNWGHLSGPEKLDKAIKEINKTLKFISIFIPNNKIIIWIEYYVKLLNSFKKNKRLPY